MEFQDTEEQCRKEYETETGKEFYCGSSCSWGQEVSSENFEIIKNLKVGETSVLVLTKTPTAFAGYFKAHTHYRCYDKSKVKQYTNPEEHLWVKVLSIVDTTHPDRDYCFEGKVAIQRVDEPKDVPHKEKYASFEEYMKEWHGYDSRDQSKGRYGLWSNPNVKWDWYQVGGRWSGFLKLKDGIGIQGKLGVKSWTNENEEIPMNKADQARKCDIDFDGMRKEKFEESCKEYEEFEIALKDNPEKAMNEHYWTYGIKNVGDKDNIVLETREQYLKRTANPSTFAVVKDGKWYERGEMGWWGCVGNEKDHGEWNEEFMKLLESVSDDALITIVDCHI